MSAPQEDDVPEEDALLQSLQLNSVSDPDADVPFSFRLLAGEPSPIEHVQEFRTSESSFAAVEEKLKSGEFASFDEMYPRAVDAAGRKIAFAQPSDQKLCLVSAERELNDVEEHIVSLEKALQKSPSASRRRKIDALYSRRDVLCAYMQLLSEGVGSWAEYKSAKAHWDEKDSVKFDEEFRAMKAREERSRKAVANLTPQQVDAMSLEEFAQHVKEEAKAAGLPTDTDAFSDVRTKDEFVRYKARLKQLIADSTDEKITPNKRASVKSLGGASEFNTPPDAMISTSNTDGDVVQLSSAKVQGVALHASEEQRYCPDSSPVSLAASLDSVAIGQLKAESAEDDDVVNTMLNEELGLGPSANNTQMNIHVPGLRSAVATRYTESPTELSRVPMQPFPDSAIVSPAASIDRTNRSRAQLQLLMRQLQSSLDVFRMPQDGSFAAGQPHDATGSVSSPGSQQLHGDDADDDDEGPQFGFNASPTIMHLSSNRFSEVNHLSHSNGLKKAVSNSLENMGAQRNDEDDQELVFDGLIGQGATCKVYRGRIVNHANGTEENVAVKLIPCVDMSEKTRRLMDNELYTFQHLHHENVIAYRHCYYDEVEKDYVVVMELADLGSLSSVVDRAMEGYLSENVVRALISQVVSGLAYLHSSQIIHRDIKPANILLTSRGYVKISDFGASLHVLGLEAMQRSVVGTPHYCAPEVVLSQPYAERCDIWSLGCTCLELLTGSKPYADEQGFRVFFAIADAAIDPIPKSLKGTISDAGFAFLSSCLRRDPSERPSAEELRRHPWLQGVMGRGHLMTALRSEVEFDSADDDYSS